MFTAFPEMGCGVKLFTGTNANGEWTPADAAKAKAQPTTGCPPTSGPRRKVTTNGGGYMDAGIAGEIQQR
jgi:hypothetical protein